MWREAHAGEVQIHELASPQGKREAVRVLSDCDSQSAVRDLSVNRCRPVAARHSVLARSAAFWLGRVGEGC